MLSLVFLSLNCLINEGQQLSWRKAMDFASLESELSNLVAEDDLYWIRNEAKFRAVNQTANYEEFKNFVKVKMVILGTKGNNVRFRQLI